MKITRGRTTINFPVYAKAAKWSEETVQKVSELLMLLGLLDLKYHTVEYENHIVFLVEDDKNMILINGDNQHATSYNVKSIQELIKEL